MAPESSSREDRVDSVLAIAIVVLVAIVVVTFLLFMLGSAGGWLPVGVLAALSFVPYVGLPVAFLCMIALMVRVARRRARQSGN